MYRRRTHATRPQARRAARYSSTVYLLNSYVHAAAVALRCASLRFACPQVLVANKIDLVNDRVVTEDEGRLLASSHGMMHYQCSAKTGVGVSEAFMGLARPPRACPRDNTRSRTMRRAPPAMWRTCCRFFVPRL